MSENIKNENDALQSIFEWSKSQPEWQQDALRRLMFAESLDGDHILSESDINELVDICLGNKPAVPLEEKDVAKPEGQAPSIQIKSISGVEHVNNLAPKQKLSFRKNGVTVIYGDNGAGKSGYARILKQICRARGRKSEILQDIYSTSSGTPKCTVDYWENGKIESTNWEHGKESPNSLIAASVFDSKTASVHVDEENDIAYTPFSIKLLGTLVKVWHKIKDKLDNKKQQIERETPSTITNNQWETSTDVGALMDSLLHNTKIENVEKLEKLASLSTQENKDLNRLHAEFNQDKKTRVNNLKAQEKILKEIIECIEKIDDAISNETANKITELSEKYNYANKALAAFEKDQFNSKSDNDFLDGTGGDVWRLLWQAAREYSKKFAYPENDFPMIEDGAKCVLCQQDIEDTNVVDRLKGFEEFVQGQVVKQLQTAETQLVDFINEKSQSIISISEAKNYKNSLLDKLGDEILSAKFSDYMAKAIRRFNRIERTKKNTTLAIPESIKEILQKAAAELNKKLQKIESDEDDSSRQVYNELRDRKWLCGVKDDVIKEIARKKDIKKIDDAIYETKPGNITQQSTLLAKSLINKRLCNRFSEEVKKLNIQNHDINLKKGASKDGVPKFKISITNSSGVKLEKVLSEGEHRGVAMCAFLAELSTADNYSSVIFDDPTSSFDHINREVIAEMLAVEGKKRQVIIFTHDVVFLLCLKEFCQKNNVEIVSHHIIKKPDNISGYCKGTIPNKANDTMGLIENIKTRLKNARCKFNDDPYGEWENISEGMIKDIRVAWESAVEEAISPVLKTFASKVDTKGLSQLSTIELKDAKDMRGAYGRCANYIHKRGSDSNPPPIDPKIIERELKVISDWVETIKQRQKKIEKK